MTWIDRDALATSIGALRATALMTSEAWLTGYLSDGRQRIKLLTEACGAGDWPAALFNAHALKGDASHVGAAQLAKRAAAMEVAIHAQDTRQFEELLADLKNCFDQTSRELMLILSERPRA